MEGLVMGLFHRLITLRQLLPVEIASGADVFIPKESSVMQDLHDVVIEKIRFELKEVATLGDLESLDFS